MITQRTRLMVATCWSLTAALLLPTTGATAEPIRILVVMPAEAGKLAQQVKRFEDALRRSRGPIARAAYLGEADAVVEFTSYRRVTSDNAKPQDWWSGHYVLLQPPPQGNRRFARAQRFAYVVIDREDWQVEPVLNMLGTTLSGALGLVPASQKKESPEAPRRRTRS
jgi:hypothetical protein